MPDYRVSITLASPLLTPLLSGTVFGHLCWAWRYLESRAPCTLSEWLERLPDEPFLISDAFPAGCVPRPLLPSPPPADQDQTIESLDLRKKARKAEWMPVAEFLRLRPHLTREELDKVACDDAPRPAPVRVAHNRIHRLSGSTPPSGGLFFYDEWWPDARSAGLEIYIQSTLDPAWIETLFAHAGQWGFGKEASTGRGRFTASISPDPTGLLAGPGPDRMSLSHGTLTSNMRNPRYRLRTLYGRLGSVLAMSRNPFKYPLLLLRPGAVFTPGDGGPFGELLSGVHPELEWVRHNAWHLTAPFDAGRRTEPAPETATPQGPAPRRPAQ